MEKAAKEEWRAHWPVVMASLVAFSFASQGAFTLGLFMGPLEQEFGWPRSQITIGTTLSAVIAVLLSPFVGALIDRWGTRPLAIPGLLGYMIAVACFSLANGSYVQWLGLWTFAALITLFVKPTMWTNAVASVFSTGRSLALGFTLCGTALAQIIAPPLAEHLISNHGWRAAFVGISVLWGTPALLLAIFFLHDAHANIRKQNRQNVAQVAAKPDFAGLSIREASRSLPLWRIGLATFIGISFGVAAMVHQVPILIEAGVTREHAAWLASLSGVAGIIGKLATGYLMDKRDPGLIAFVTMSLSGVGFFMLLFPSPTIIVLAMIIIGYAAGTKTQICAYLTSRYAGMLNYGKIFGMMASILMLASGLGPTLAGVVHDQFNSYSVLLIAGIPGCIISGLLLVGMGPFPDFEKRRLVEAEAAVGPAAQPL